jgi:hypothetical protein
MAIKATLHGFGARDVLGKQMAPAVYVADDDISDPLADGGLYRIVATTDCTLAFGPTVTDALNGEPWPSGHVEVRLLDEGDKIACGAGI